MKSIKKALKTALRLKRSKRIVLTFTENGDGTTTSTFKADKGIPVGMAVTMIDRLKAQISAGLAKRCSEGMYKPSDPKRRAFVAKQTLGDIIK